MCSVFLPCVIAYVVEVMNANDRLRAKITITNSTSMNSGVEVELGVDILILLSNFLRETAVSRCRQLKLGYE